MSHSLIVSEGSLSSEADLETPTSHPALCSFTPVLTASGQPSLTQGPPREQNTWRTGTWRRAHHRSLSTAARDGAGWALTNDSAMSLMCPPAPSVHPTRQVPGPAPPAQRPVLQWAAESSSHPCGRLCVIASMTTLPGATCAQGLLYGQCSSRTFHGPSMHWGMLLHQNTSKAAIPTPCPGGPLPGHAGGLHAVGHGLAQCGDGAWPRCPRPSRGTRGHHLMCYRAFADTAWTRRPQAPDTVSNLELGKKLGSDVCAARGPREGDSCGGTPGTAWRGQG